MTRFLGIVLSWVLAVEPALAQTCALDTHLTGIATGFSTTTWTSFPITTAHSNELVVVVVSALRVDTLSNSITGISDAAGLSWSSRAGRTAAGTANCGPGIGSNEDCSVLQYVFTAYSSGLLSADVITINWSAAPVSFAGLGVATFIGATPTFDPNGALPVAVVTYPAPGSPTAGGPLTVSTSHASDTILVTCLASSGAPSASACAVGSGGQGTAVAGTSYIDVFQDYVCQVNIGGALCGNLYYANVTAPLAASPQFGGAPMNVGANQAWIQTADAIENTCGPSTAPLEPFVWINE